MSLLVRERSRAYRLTERDAIIAERRGPLHPRQALLEWGSITKTVTASIAHRLAETGELDLSTPVVEFFPSSGLPEAVTVRTLIEHTSGLPRLPADMFKHRKDLADPYARYTNDYFDGQVIPRLRQQHVGTVGAYDYSNLGYALLTRVLETASGRAWWNLADELVLQPVGITDATIVPDPYRVPVLHTWTGKVRKPWTDFGPFVGAGGILSTFDTLAKYATSSAQLHRTGAPLPGWQHTGQLVWHNGHKRDQGAFIGFTPTLIVTVHTLGHRFGTADATATRLLLRHL